MPLTTLTTKPTAPVVETIEPIVTYTPEPPIDAAGNPPVNQYFTGQVKASELVLRARGVSTALLTYRIAEKGFLDWEWDRALTGWGIEGQSPLDPNLVGTPQPEPTVGDHVRIADIPPSTSVPDVGPLSAELGGAVQSLGWFGYILGESLSWVRDPSTGPTYAERERVTGVKTLRVVGYEHFLTRTQLRNGVVADNRTGALPGATRRVERPMVFNGGIDSLGVDGHGERKNRSPDQRTVGLTPAPLQTYVFTDGIVAGAELWNSREIVDYLLAHHGPRDQRLTPRALPVPYKLGEGAELLENFHPTIKTEGRTVLEVINEIIHPKRGLTWYARPHQDSGDLDYIEIVVRVTSYNQVPLPGGGSLPASTEDIELICDDDPTIQQLQVGDAGEQKYHAIRMRGAPMTTTFTVSWLDGTLQANWLPTTAVEYLAAAVAALDYPSQLKDQQRRNDAMRREPKFDRVFSSFVIPVDWSGKSADGSGTIPANTRGSAFPKIDQYGNDAGSHEVFLPHLRISEETRLPAAAPAIGQKLFEPPMVFMKDTDDHWRLADRMNDPTVTGESRLASYHLRIDEGGAGFSLHSTSSVNHTLALGSFTGAEPTGREPEVDWKQMRATITVVSDDYCEAWYQPNGLVTDDPLEELVINMGDSYRRDFLAKDTITGIEDGDLVVAGVEQVLRDDRPSLAFLAAAAHQWYTDERRSLAATWRQMIGNISPCDMITDVGMGLVTINSTVGEVTYNFNDGWTTITTVEDGVTIAGMMG